ncbi:hypothetical protein F4782DRAFT_544697 [Xylaria castorea]|nr:hypothetical protein F4782DRAFT_544697 [Xylaria castorea]
MHWTYLAVIIIVFISICWYFSLLNLPPQLIAPSKAVFKYLKIAFQAIEKRILQLACLFNESLQEKTPWDRTTQTPDCDNYAGLRYKVTELQEQLQREDFDACIQSVMHEQKIELEVNLNEPNTELKRRGNFLRAVKEQANCQRTKTHSPREELSPARDDNADFGKGPTVQQDLERLWQQNAQPTTANLRQLELTLREKHRALRAERELDIWADKIKMLVGDLNELCQELGKMRAELRHQERQGEGAATGPDTRGD